MENNIEANPINQDILAGKWKQMRGELKTWWSKLNDDDFDRISGQKDKLIGLIQDTDMLASRPNKRLSGASKSMATRQAGPLAVCRSRHESSARLPRRRRTRRRPLSVGR